MVRRTFTVREVNSRTKLLSLEGVATYVLSLSIATLRNSSVVTIDVSTEVEQLELITALVSVSNTREVNSKCLRSYILLVVGGNCCTSSILLTNCPVVVVERQDLHTGVVNCSVNLEATVQLILQDVLRELCPCGRVGDRITEVEGLAVLRIVVNVEVQRSVVDVDQDVTIEQHITLLVLQHDANQRLTVLRSS